MVVTNVPPKPWTNLSNVMAQLANVRPMDKPSNTKLWAEAKKWIDSAKNPGSANDWADDKPIGPTKTSSELWEALRITGDSEHGYGTLSERWTDDITSQIHKRRAVSQ
ncbi:hypothetical protein F5Y07DRAFT_181563 [Xylaria sp. FL0933]|nr:hypothetical protein F5Y07DRAFT_181563 [Xylaria sp. FL0933]